MKTETVVAVAVIALAGYVIYCLLRRPAASNPLAGALDRYQLFSGEGMNDPRYG